MDDRLMLETDRKGGKKTETSSRGAGEEKNNRAANRPTKKKWKKRINGTLSRQTGLEGTVRKGLLVVEKPDKSRRSRKA